VTDASEIEEGTDERKEARAEVERFRLAMQLGGSFAEAQRLIAAWDAGEIEEGQI